MRPFACLWTKQLPYTWLAHEGKPQNVSWNMQTMGALAFLCISVPQAWAGSSRHNAGCPGMPWR